MARKHAKKFIVKQPVTRVLVKAATHTRERVVTEVPEGTEGAIPVAQDDGSVKHFLVTFREASPARYRLVPVGPTLVGRDRKNATDNMASKGRSEAKPLNSAGRKK